RFARLFVVLAIGLFVAGLWQQRVQRIVVEGLLLGPVDPVHAACAPLLGQRWLRPDTAQVHAALRAQPWFEHVGFGGRLTATLVVRLAEAEPVFHLEHDGARLAVDAHGCVLAGSASLDVRALPALRGAVVRDGALGDEDRARVAKLVDSLARAPWPWDGGLAA